MLPDYINIRRGYAKSNEESMGKTDENEQVSIYFFKYFRKKIHANNELRL